MNGRIPPQAVDFEEAILGALLLEKSAFARVEDTLKQEMFYKESHREIFRAIHQLIDNKEPVDILTVKNQLKKNGKMDLLPDGAYYLTVLTSSVASAANIEYHAKVVRIKYVLRGLILAGQDIVDKSYADTTDLDELSDIVNEVEAKLAMALNAGKLDVSELKDEAYEELKTIEKVAQARELALETGQTFLTGMPSGSRDLDEYTCGFQKGQFVIVAARPAMGKTSFAINIALETGKQHNVLFFSLEMGVSEITRRFIGITSGVNINKIARGDLNRDDWGGLNAGVAVLDGVNVMIDDTPSIAIETIREKSRKIKAEKGLDMIVIDYLQLCTTQKKCGNRELEISHISRTCKEIAKELGVPVVGLAQLSRAVESRPDKKPILSDLRESGGLEQDSDIVMFLYRAEYYGIDQFSDGSSTKGVAEILLRKHRNGPIGDVRMGFERITTKFYNI